MPELVAAGRPSDMPDPFCKPDAAPSAKLRRVARRVPIRPMPSVSVPCRFSPAEALCTSTPLVHLTCTPRCSAALTADLCCWLMRLFVE
jgi:hypothetical protein